MSYPPNIERRDSFSDSVAKEVEQVMRDRELADQNYADNINRITTTLQRMTVDTDVVVQVLATLSCEAHKSGLLHGADLDALDEAASFIGDTP